MLNSRDIAELDPVVRAVCEAHIASCAAEGLDILVTSTYRDSEAQDALYRVGRDSVDIRRRVTNSKGGESWHNFRCAYDVVPLIGGKCVWDDKNLWDKVIALGVAADAEAGALWSSFPDRPHFQHRPEGLTLIEANDRFATHGTIFI